MVMTHRKGPWLLALVAVLLAVVMALGLMLVPRTTAQADNLHDFPLRITYKLAYQREVDLAAPLARGTAEWTVRSLSDWEFRFLSGPDAGTVYRLSPDGTFSSTDGRSGFTSTKHEAGTEMIPLPDMAVDNYARTALGVGDLPDVIAVDRGAAAENARASAAAKSGFQEDQLLAAVVIRNSTVDAFEYDTERGEWVGSPGIVHETIVVDAESHGIILREIVWEGQLIRRVEITAVESLP